MGDAGSLAIGGCIATISVLLKQEALFLILGGLFVVEAISSQIQDKIGIKWLGRRLFYRAPFHHQMQHTGLAETKVVIRLWIVAGILALAALATIKLRWSRRRRVKARPPSGAKLSAASVEAESPSLGLGP